ncbi:MAG TPA: cyclopropane-fatty-acyl-phospholipid synthase family protein [Terriglobales bacterium]|nr:cyclopropane-fatty-acyl-phospholipid synthase family protein [Terriglobales bacterium]
MGLLARSSPRQSPVQISIEFLDFLFARYPRRDFCVRFWDGSSWGRVQDPRFTLVLNHPGALRAMFLNPSDLSVGEAYIARDYDIEGDIHAALDMAGYLLEQEHQLGEKLHLVTMLGKLPAEGRPRPVPRYGRIRGPIHSKKRDRQAVTYHYDLPAEFYGLFLDSRMVYSCAYFASPEDDLDCAQERKLDYICRKLRLRAGDQLLDIGCGWGGLIVHAASRYGARCLGITLSVSQAQAAQHKIRDAGIEHLCAVEVCDYRDLDKARHFDKIASVGMFEHVGEEMLPTYFGLAWKHLRPGGVFLNHGIAYSATYRRQGPSFTDKYVFPDGDLVPISTTLRIAEQTNFEVRDLESLREHYVLTLRNWVDRLENNAPEARRISDDTTYRIWRLYMAGSAHWFRTGRLNLYQTLLAKPVHGNSGLPLTREDWYCK